MKSTIGIVLAFGFILASNVWAGVYWPSFEKTGIFVPEQVKRVDCDMREVSKDIVAQKEVVPTILYHYGERKYMEENVKARTIPEEAWNKFIMGDQGRFKLGTLRRGLYGTATLDVNHFGDSTYNRLIEIHIKPECLKPNQVASLSDLIKDPNFIAWLKAAKGLPFTDLNEVKSKCFPWGAGYPVSTKFGLQPSSNRVNQAFCALIIEKYLKDASIKVVQDNNSDVKKSFYIRDRSCVETIRGTPEETIQIFAEKSYLWLNSCNPEPTFNRSAGKLFGIVVQSLKDAKSEISESTYSKLIDNVNLLESRDTDDFKNEWAAVIKAHARCFERGKMDEFVKEIPSDFSISNSSSSSTKDLDALCR